MTEHEQVFELLPWLVNNRLTSQQHMRVTQHLEQCAHCRSELVTQQRLHAALNQAPKVEFAPQTSFNKLWDKIVTAEATQQRRENSLMPSLLAGLSWLRQHWQVAALTLQTAIIVGLVGALSLQTHRDKTTDNAAAYRTVTSPTVSNNRNVIHVVFDEATRLADVKDILGKSGLSAVSGPTAAGVYTLAPINPSAPLDLRETVHALRDDPRIRFAELSAL